MRGGQRSLDSPLRRRPVRGADRCSPTVLPVTIAALATVGGGARRTLTGTDRHKHGDGQDDIDWAALAEQLAVSAEVDASWYAECAGYLVDSDDRLLVDVGCGGAGMVEALASEASEKARIVGLEPTPEIAAVARDRLGDADLRPPRVEVVEAEASDLATYTDPGTVDLIWASAVIHHIGDQQQAIIDLTSFLAPGGRLAIAEGGLGPANIPWDVGVGKPGLMQRLLGANDEWFRRMREGLPGSVRMPIGWAVALRRAGLAEVRSTTPAPRLTRTAGATRTQPRTVRAPWTRRARRRVPRCRRPAGLGAATRPGRRRLARHARGPAVAVRPDGARRCSARAGRGSALSRGFTRLRQIPSGRPTSSPRSYWHVLLLLHPRCCPDSAEGAWSPRRRRVRR